MKKIKKIILIFIIIILFLLFILFFIKLKNYKSEKEIYELCENINNYNNLHVHENFVASHWRTGERDIYWKDNICIDRFSDFNGVSFSYLDSLNDIGINDSEKRVEICENETDFTQKEKISYLIPGGFFSKEKWKFIKYKFCGMEDINRQECYKINLEYKLQKGFEETYWVEKDNGLILKKEICWPGGLSEIRFYSYEFDSVTDEDIEKPDIKAYEEKGYEIIYK